MESNSNKRRVTLGPVGIAAVVLTIIYAVLKAAGVINWSWLWVLSPLWVSGIICVLCLACIGWRYYVRRTK